MYNINLLVTLTEIESVYCAVRPQSSNTNQGNFVFKPSTLVFSCQYRSTSAHTHLDRLPEGQMDEAWEPSRKQCFLGNQGALHS